MNPHMTLPSAESLLTNDEREQRFHLALKSLSEMLKTAGIANRITDNANQRLPHFTSLDATAQTEHLEEIEIFVTGSRELIDDGKSPEDTPSLAWQIIRKMGFTLNFGFFDLMKKGDVVEVYNTAGRPIFRNLDYYRYTSHSLESLFTLNWSKLGKRDPIVEQQIHDLVVKIFVSPSDVAIKTELPEHTYCEVNSAQMLEAELNIKYLLPLRREGKVSAVLGITRVELIKRI